MVHTFLKTMKRLILIVAVVLIPLHIYSFSIRSFDARVLCRALKSQDMQLFEELLNKGAYTNAYTHSVFFLPIAIICDSGYPETPLHVACSEGNYRAVQLLLEKGADPNLNLLLDFTCIGTVYANSDARANRFDIVPLLISYGAKTSNAGLGFERGTEHAAFLEAFYAKNDTIEQSIALIEMVCENPSTITNKYGESLLYITQSKPLADWLIQNGADINHRDNFGNTPLINATKNHKGEIVELLLAENAMTEIKNDMGKSALDIAIENGSVDIIELFQGYAA